MSVLTFLFTDIEGSTRRWEADAAAMRVALETHNQVLRDAVDANDGRVFNYTGDGMCAVFTSPVRLSMLRSQRNWHSNCRCGWESPPAKQSWAGITSARFSTAPRG